MNDVLVWWRGGDLLMPIMLGVALVLYGCIGERIWALYGPGARRSRRHDELRKLLDDAAPADKAADSEYTAWLARYVATTEEEELSRGVALIRTLALSLPLLGLLGTVSGMVVTFASLTGGNAVAQEASAGIGLALTATQYGMALAIPAVLAEWLLRRRIDVLVHHREHQLLDRQINGANGPAAESASDLLPVVVAAAPAAPVVSAAPRRAGHGVPA